MLKLLFDSSEHLGTEWSKMFEDLYINSLPTDYIDLVILEFFDGRQWEIDLTSVNVDSNFKRKVILESVREYEAEISNVALKMNMPKLIKDITFQSKNIF